MERRLGSSILKTDEAVEAIEKVRKHFHGTVKPHAVLARATEIGLSVLVTDPNLFIEDETK